MATGGMHAAVGMALVKVLPLWLGLPLAFLSHFVMDLYPEKTGIRKENAFKKENLLFTIIEILLVLLVIAVCIIKGSWIFFIAAILANVPDIWDGINKLFKRPPFWYNHGGIFPFKPKVSWQEFAMRAWKNAILDLTIVGLLLLLILL